MKKTFFSLLMALVALSAIAQGVGDAFYIYRNDGQFNAFFRDEVDSIAYSYYDTDSVYYNDIVTQVIYTPDSIYRIPLAAIDSVGFVQPETIYREDAVPLTGDLFDYLISTDSLCLTFSPSIPLSLLPKVDDKLVTTDLTDKLPCGFLGIVRQISNNADGYQVCCDSLALEDAVTQFYGVVELASQQEDGNVRRYLRRKASDKTTHPFTFKFPLLRPVFELSGIIQPKKVYNIEGKASADMQIKAFVTGKLTRVVDVLKGIFYNNYHSTTDLETVTTLELAGVANRPVIQNPAIDRDFPMPWGYPLYIAFGPQLDISGELAVGTTIYANARHTTDITYYPLASLTPVTSAIFNKVNFNTDMTHFDMDWMYFAARGSAKLYLLGRVGLPFGKHEVGWVGAEFEFGVKGEAELAFDVEDLADAEANTRFYNSLKENTKLTVKPYWGATGKISGWNDRLNFKFLGRDDFSFWGTKWEWDLLPKFTNTKAKAKGATSADATTTLTNECLFPYTVGFSLFDENENRVGGPQYKNQKYRKPSDFPSSSYTLTFDGLQSEQKYKVYPTIRFFGINMLASPSADIDMHFPVSIDDFKQTKSQYKKGGFTHEGVSYDYRYDVAVTVSIEDLEGVADWGYVYRDPNGKDKEISLRSHGTSYTDNSYAYFRNTSPATVTLFGYVKYAGSSEPIYGEPEDFEVSHALTSCPDTNHPHMIDLGIGTKWACCNVGAHSPEEYGGYYAWGEVSEKDYYALHTYQYAYQDNNGSWWDDDTQSWYSCRSLGSDISGTGYDVAHVQWGGSWCMPTLDEIKALVNNCSSVWTTENGVYGRRFTGPNGGSIFLPVAGSRWYSGLGSAGEYGFYWSSTQLPDYSDFAYYLFFDSGYADWDSYVDRRYLGQSVRPVVRN